MRVGVAVYHDIRGIFRCCVWPPDALFRLSRKGRHGKRQGTTRWPSWPLPRGRSFSVSQSRSGIAEALLSTCDGHTNKVVVLSPIPRLLIAASCTPYPTIIPKSGQAALPGIGRVMRDQSEHHLIGVPLIFPVPSSPTSAPPASIVLAAVRRPLVSRLLDKGAKYCREVGMDISRTGSTGACSANACRLVAAPVCTGTHARGTHARGTQGEECNQRPQIPGLSRTRLQLRIKRRN